MGLGVKQAGEIRLPSCMISMICMLQVDNALSKRFCPPYVSEAEAYLGVQRLGSSSEHEARVKHAGNIRLASSKVSSICLRLAGSLPCAVNMIRAPPISMALRPGVGGWVIEKFNQCVLKGHARPAWVQC